MSRYSVLDFNHFRAGLQFLAATALIGGILHPAPTLAQTQLQCQAFGEVGPTIENQASFTYTDVENTVRSVELGGFSNAMTNTITRSGILTVAPQGVYNSNSQLVFGLGNVANALRETLLQQGFTQDEATRGSLAAVQSFASLPSSATVEQAIAAARNALAKTLPNKTNLLNQINSISLTADLIGLAPSTLESLGLTDTTTANIAQVAVNAITASPQNTSFSQVSESAWQAVINAAASQADVLTEAQQSLDKDLKNFQSGTESLIRAGDTLQFQFRLTSTGTAPIEIPLPTASALQQTGLTGSAEITAVEYTAIASNADGTSATEPTTPTPSSITLRPNEQGRLTITVKVSAVPTGQSVVSVGISSGCGGSSAQQLLATVPPLPKPLVDPFGRITGCAGEVLSDYNGFSVGVYAANASDPMGEVSELVPLTVTEVPDNPNNNIPAGIAPNSDNSNPFFLTNNDQGKYNFLLDANRGQLDQGRAYVLLINPPAGSIYSQRRIRIVIGQRNGTLVDYTATALDGRPINSTNNRTSLNGTIDISDAERIGLNLVALDFDSSVCQDHEIQIMKSSDRAAAEPGDTVVYRLSIRNLSSAPINNVVVTDTLPLGFDFVPTSVRGELQGQSTEVTTTSAGSAITFNSATPIPSGQVLNIAYATLLTPDSMRGTGKNSAIVNGLRADNNWSVKDGPAIHSLRIRPGILTDCGTIIGRVFVDKNFDGEQQNGEPGVPNAVIFMDDGNRITTDPNGLFSVANVISGYRTGVLDLSSLPGYTLAPNLYVKERNSQSRLVHLQPGGMVRMNFAVTPAFQEGSQPTP